MMKENSKLKSGRIKSINLILLTAVIVTGIIVIGCRTSGNATGADDENVTKITTAEQFDEVVIKSSKPVLVDFFATWCGPCKRLAPIIHELAKEYEGRVVFAKVDIDKVQELAMRYKVSSIPDVRIFNKGKEIKKLIGLRGSDGYSSILDSALAGNTGKEIK